MLRASIEYQGKETDLRAVTEGAKGAESGVVHGEWLLAFAEAAVGDDPAALATARDALRAAAGSAALVDAAGVVGNFQRMVRIADGAGIDLDAPVVLASEGFREEIGLSGFAGSDRKTDAGWVGRLVGPVLRPVLWRVLRWLGQRDKR